MSPSAAQADRDPVAAISAAYERGKRTNSLIRSQ
jgi:hypothetical protein